MVSSCWMDRDEAFSGLFEPRINRFLIENSFVYLGYAYHGDLDLCEQVGSNFTTKWGNCGKNQSYTFNLSIVKTISS